MSSQFTLSNDQWDLHRRADRDKARHNEKIKEAIRKNLQDIISQEDIITSDGDKIIKIPVKGLELPRIRFDPNDQQHVGQGKGGTKQGDVIARESGDQKGIGKQAGTDPGVDYYDAEFTLAELAEMIFEDLNLPNMEDKAVDKVTSEHIVFNTITKKGILSNLDRKRTLIEAWKRNAAQGTGKKWEVQEEDKRFKNYEVITEPIRNAVVFAMRDISGSMGEYEAYIARSFYFWMTRFLRTKYQNTEIVFITCHTEAKEVSETQFFAQGESGGTRMSSAYSCALDIIGKRYNPREWNIYPFLFSDGYNHGDDECVKLVKELMAISNLVGYGEIAGEYDRNTSFAYLGKAYVDAFSKEKRFKIAKINSKDDVWPALKTFFSESQLPHG